MVSISIPQLLLAFQTEIATTIEWIHKFHAMLGWYQSHTLAEISLPSGPALVLYYYYKALSFEPHEHLNLLALITPTILGERYKL